jgi:four helix bundle protein
VRDFHELKVWERSHQLTLAVYRATATFPGDERYGLTSQLRRASASIPANIAEGCGRDSDRDFARFLRIASGSASETSYHLILARDLEILPPPVFQELTSLIDEIRRMLTALIRRFSPPQSPPIE